MEKERTSWQVVKERDGKLAAFARRKRRNANPNGKENARETGSDRKE